MLEEENAGLINWLMD